MISIQKKTNLPSACTVCEQQVGKLPRIAIDSFNKINSHKSWICVRTDNKDWYVFTSCTNGINRGNCCSCFCKNSNDV